MGVLVASLALRLFVWDFRRRRNESVYGCLGVKVEVGEELLFWRWGLVRCGVKSLNGTERPSPQHFLNIQHTADCTAYVNPIAAELLRVRSSILREIPQTREDPWRMF
jgi:hypothetical protein